MLICTLKILKFIRRLVVVGYLAICLTCLIYYWCVSLLYKIFHLNTIIDNWFSLCCNIYLDCNIVKQNALIVTEKKFTFT